MKIRNISKFLLLSFVLLLCAIMLFACTGKEETKREYLSSGNGAVVTETVAGKTVYRAVPDKWFEITHQ